LQNAEIMAEQSRKEATAGNALDAFETDVSRDTTESQMEANNEMADKMAEYTIAQGHKADYTDDYREMAAAESSTAENSEDSGAD